MVSKALILATLLLAGCQTASGDFCDIADPIRLSEPTIATMSDAEVVAVLALNEKGEALCGWQP